MNNRNAIVVNLEEMKAMLEKVQNAVKNDNYLVMKYTMNNIDVLYEDLKMLIQRAE